ncbi:Heat shock protein 12A [Armadillidium nasatum]|uniref:Heat shock protein 12A n=1 Tax=Armadillidium nasatum TaxID=96803 RepID=A0A5N5TMQ0_9CRUS|nr:Heat shock protein 12A [Armadillidium nasatum]
MLISRSNIALAQMALTRDTLLTAKNGKQVPALKIFYLALRYFRDHAIKELSEQTGIEVEDEDIRWVITVPAIWSHPAKQFMRTAAYQAGMGSPSRQDKLLIALEPEAAAIYCRRLKQNQLLQDKSPENKLKQLSSVSSSGSVRSMKGKQDEQIPELDRDELVSRSLKKNEKVGDWLKKGTTYMVVDCGGGTVDITVHQMTDRRSGHLKELHKATGGSYGSIGVDREFEELLGAVFGSDFMRLFKEQRSAAYVNLMIAFESRKRNASPYKSSPLNIALPFSFIDFYKKTCKKEAIRSVLSSPEVEGIIQYMFLVGGFSESELLQKHIRDTFSSRDKCDNSSVFSTFFINDSISLLTLKIYYLLQGMGLAILRGAVQFGLDPSVVTVRRSRLTYGVGILNTFIEDVHPPDKKVLAAGREWCADILDKFVEVDESVALGDVVTRSYTPATPTQKSVILHLYATSQQNVKTQGLHRLQKFKPQMKFNLDKGK